MKQQTPSAVRDGLNVPPVLSRAGHRRMPAPSPALIETVRLVAAGLSQGTAGLEYALDRIERMS